MSIFAAFKSFADVAKQTLEDKYDAFKNRHFATALMSSCALMAMADGDLGEAEKTKIIEAIKKNPKLQTANVGDLIKKFQGFVDELKADPTFGRINLEENITKVKDDLSCARQLIAIAIMVGNADGTFDDKEQKAASTIAKLLGQDPTDFALPA